MKKLLALSLLFAISLSFPAFTLGEINIRVSPDPVVVQQGTDATFDIVLSQTAGESFDAFTLAFAVGDGGSALGNAQDDDNLLITDFVMGAIFDMTDFMPVISGGGVGESAILIDFNRAAGNTENILAEGVVASFTVDTSTALQDEFVLDVNIADSTAIFDDGAALGITATAGTLQIAVPEPSSVLFLGGSLLGCLVGRRRKC
jgi:hypothetical protein